ncbi:hypothetical protein AKO1_007042 [Acrasis kona]|uniref:P-type phospholipid transporter n=1 Tax=Acrasis kona TaxID=1008807 RepID=A0AAW2YTT6_9EUKA
MRNEIKTLKDSSIRCKIITGDTVFTATSVAIDSGVLDGNGRVLSAEVEYDQYGEPSVVWKEIQPGTNDQTELAITGPAFSLLRNHCADKAQKVAYYRLVARTNVFAEMLATQKAELVQDLKQIDFTVVMVGDGSNDSMALNVADVGISITDAETSFAAQFTLERGGQCCSMLVREGRALLDKILYNMRFVVVFVFVQYVVILLNDLEVPSELQLVFSHFFMGFTLIFSVSFNKPSEKLDTRRPPRQILRFPLLASVIGQIFIQVFFLVFAMMCLRFSPWYIDYKFFMSPEVSLGKSFLFMYSNFQYIAVTLAYQFNYKYIVPYKNYTFFVTLGITVSMCILILFPSPSFKYLSSNSQEMYYFVRELQRRIWCDMFQMVWIDPEVSMELADKYLYFRLVNIGIVLSNFIVSWFYEFIVMRIEDFIKRRRRKKPKASRLAYRRLLADAIVN